MWLALARQWILKQLNWEKVIFWDEKSFIWIACADFIATGTIWEIKNTTVQTVNLSWKREQWTLKNFEISFHGDHYDVWGLCPAVQEEQPLSSCEKLHLSARLYNGRYKSCGESVVSHQQDQSFGLTLKMPDLNIMQNVWGILIRCVYVDKWQIDTKVELIWAIKSTCRTST